MPGANVEQFGFPAVVEGMARLASDLDGYGVEALAGSPEFLRRMSSARA